MSFQGKTVILTGASKGIGRALAINLANQGANLSLVAPSKDELKEVQIECKKAGAKCLVFIGSVSNEKLANKTIAETIEAYGQIDFMINNAGYGVFGPTDTISAETWSDV